MLQKPGRLTNAEFDVIKSHVIVGERLCGSLRSLAPVRQIIRHHHERRDGSGYPDGLSGEAIPLLAQIMGIVDGYDAMTTDRPYRAALSAEHAFFELEKDVHLGLQSRELASAFLSLHRAGGLVSDQPAQHPMPAATGTASRA